MEITEALELLNKKVKYPEMEAKLKRFRDVYYGISLHTLGACPSYTSLRNGECIKPPSYYGTEYQRLFEYHLLNAYERESTETRNYRYARYKPMTKAPFSTITDLVTGTIFQDGNYSIEIADEKDREYIFGNNFYGYDLVGYFANIGFRSMTEDPNGLFVRMPKYAFYETDDTDKGLEIEVCFINTPDIKYLSHDVVIFHYKGYGWYIDEQVIYRFKYDAKSKKYDLLEREGFYAHMFGRLPVSVAGGEWNSIGYYDSFYDKAKAAADEFISAHSIKQFTDTNNSYPYVTEVSDTCPTCNGIGQIQIPCDTCPNGIDLRTCNFCGGSGQQAADPAKRKIVPIEDMAKATKFIEITTPDTAINKVNADTTKELMRLLMDALNLITVEEAQSGVAKAIDQDKLFKFISKISNHLFDKLIYDTVTDIIAYRNVVTNDFGNVQPAVYDFKIQKPTQFQIKTAKDLLGDITESGLKKLPSALITEQLIDYTDKQYGGDEITKKKVSIISQLDPLFTNTQDEIESMTLTGDITPDVRKLHIYLPLILDGVIRNKDKEWFLDADYDTIKKEVDALKPKYITTRINTVVDNAINGLQQP